MLLFKIYSLKKILPWRWRIFSSKKKHVHIAFKIPISEYGSFGRDRFYFGLVGKEKNIFWRLQNIYPRLIASLKWKFDCLFWEESKKTENNALERMCNKIVYVIYKTFTRKYYFSVGKGTWYFIVKKKRGGLLGEEKNSLHKKIFDISRSVFHCCGERHDFV